MDLWEALRKLKDQLDPPPQMAPERPALVDEISVRPASRVEEVARVPAETAEEYARALRRARGLPPTSLPAAEAEQEAARWRRENLSNQELIRRANEALALSRSASSPNANLSDAELDAKIEAEHGPKHLWKMPGPTLEGTAVYEDLLAAAKKANAPGQDWEGSVGYGFGKPRPLISSPDDIKIEKRVPAMPKATTLVAKAAAGGAGAASPPKAAMEMALASIPSPDVRALLAKRMGAAMDGDPELRAAQAKEERLTSLAGLQRQLAQAAAVLGGDRYDDTAAAGAERSAGIGTRGVLAQRAQQDKAGQSALDAAAQMERERAARAGEGLDARRLGESERHNREGEKIDWYGARTARAKAMKEGAAYDKEVQKLAKEVGGNVAIGAEKLREIDSALREQGIGGIDDTATKRDLQGAGPLTNLATRFTGNLFVSDKGARLRNSVVDLAAIVLYLRTGKAANRAEAETVARSFGLAPGSSETEFRQGIQRMRDEFAARAKQAEAGFSPGAVSTFEARGGTTSGKLGEIGRKPITRTVGGETRTWDGSKWVR